MNRLDEIRARLGEDNPYRPHLRGKVGCRRADDWNLQQTRDLRDLLAVVEAAYRVQQSYEREDVRTTGLGIVAIEQLDAALARLNVCMCGAQLEDGECRSDHHMDFAVTDVTA